MAVRTPYTPLYGDVLDYLERSGLPSVGGIFDDYDESKNPFIIDFEESTSSDDLDKTDSPLVQATRGGGGDFSVYNPDPTRTRTQDNYNENPYRSALYNNSFSMMGDPAANIATGALNADGLMSYEGDKQLTGIPGLAADFFKNSLVGKGIASLEDILPVNRRAILENEALGQGIRLNDIGQIVSDGGNINTAENIMAGYNLNKITADTFQKRRDMINEKMKDPVQKAAKLKALDEAEAKILGTVADRTTTIFDDQSLAKDPTYQSFDDLVAAGLLAGDDDDDDYEFNPLDIMTKQNKYYNPYEVGLISAEQQRARLEQIQRQKEAEAAAEQRRLAEEKAVADRAREKNRSVYESADRQGFTNDQGGFSTSREDKAGTSEGSGQFSPSSDRGRSGY